MQEQGIPSHLAIRTGKGRDGQRLTRRPHQPDGKGQQERCLLRLAGRWRAGLLEVERERALLERLLDPNHRGARLLVPAPELFEVEIGHRLHRGQEVIGRRRFAVVAVEVQIRAAAERLWAQQGVIHADHFCTLLIDGDGVEV